MLGAKRAEADQGAILGVVSSRLSFLFRMSAKSEDCFLVWEDPPKEGLSRKRITKQVFGVVGRY